ncbi:hypothetical protein MLOOGBEN_06735 [Bacillus sp. EB106-08-02-XG196]|uniref:hypothetical protein n=1 Tax=Bacillus sp. EB106-08-02-XG196 TaxID=2737049 RepID=UPI0015C44251|nr:hypothetical protein [Bacillus sp. EB106-08-02-XG196]NWQ40394.1 hypothetical protein [Bacillus sp. EB106-08-02-XG196]
MKKNNSEYLQKVLLFNQYLKKYLVADKLEYINKFPNFNQIYTSFRQEDDKADTAVIVARSLIYGLENEIISEYDLDEILFLILEDSLFNTYLFNLNSVPLNEAKQLDIEYLLNSWKIPREHRIINNIDAKTIRDYVICGYRIADDENGIESLRVLLLDSKIINIQQKNEETKEVVFPTIVEIDFRRQLLHIRLRDVDNIVGESEKVSTMSGRIENTLNFISSLKPDIQYSEIDNFKTSLYNLEEYLLNEKRNQAYVKLEEFDSEIEIFTNAVCEKFNPPASHEITPREYINTGVLSIIATTLNRNELGDVVGIKFRDTQSEDRKYAEITIKDTGNKCISTSNLYWLNLSVLQNTKAIEFLKIITQVESGAVVVNMEFSLDTANIRLLQRSAVEESGARPSQEKYDEIIDFIKPFIGQ